MQIKRMRNRTLYTMRLNRRYNSFLEAMEALASVSYVVFLFYIVTSKFCFGNPFTKFQLETTFCNFTHPVEETIFHVNEVQSKVVCTVLCSNTRPCFGAFFRPGTKECIVCNNMTELLPLDGALFYRQGNSYLLIFSSIKI